MKMKNLMCIFVMLLLVATVSVEAAETYGSNVSGLWKSFETANASQTEVSNTSGIAFDPTSLSGGIYGKVYLTNNSTVDTRRGLYSVDIVNETSSRVALSGEVSHTSVAAASDGIVYVNGGAHEDHSVWKVENPNSGSPTETTLIGDYGGIGDDDIGDIDMVPTGFGGGYEAGSDLVLFDCGLNTNANSAVSVLDQSTGTTTLLWDSGSAVNTIRGRTSSYDGYAYWADYGLPAGGTNNNPYIDRINGTGVLERIFLNIDADTIGGVDSAVAINPADGSFWIVLNNGTRDVVRVDVSNATLLSGTDYIADVTFEINNWDGADIPQYAMAFSPDGKMLAMGWDQGVDKMYIYNIVPEPTTMLLLATGLVFIKRRRSK
jgi:PEP-CTERM motif